MRYVEKNLPLLLFLNKNNRINMGSNYSAPIWRTDSYKCYTCVTSLKTQRNYRLILEKFYSYTI